MLKRKTVHLSMAPETVQGIRRRPQRSTPMTDHALNPTLALSVDTIIYLVFIVIAVIGSLIGNQAKEAKEAKAARRGSARRRSVCVRMRCRPAAPTPISPSGESFSW